MLFLTLGIEGKHSLDGNVDAAKLVSIKHDLAHLLAVLQRVHRRLREQNLLAARVDLELFVKSIVPKMLHVVPFLDDAVLHWVADLQHRTGGGSLVAAHNILDDNVIVRLFLRSQYRTADDGRELVLRKVLRGVSDLEEAGASVEN